MLTSAVSGRPGIGAGDAGFSVKASIRPSLSTLITPKALACASGTSMQATVMSAPLRSWKASSFS